jgi:hypothetical protein
MIPSLISRAVYIADSVKRKVLKPQDFKLASKLFSMLRETENMKDQTDKNGVGNLPLRYCSSNHFLKTGTLSLLIRI